MLFSDTKSHAGQFDLQGITTLDENHKELFCRALANLLSTERAERTYAQILDGLPTEESFKEAFPIIRCHPVFELGHTQLCPGFLDKAREFRTRLDYAGLHFHELLLRVFNESAIGSEIFHLRLIELVIVACHQIAVFLYNLDGGLQSGSGRLPSSYCLPSSPFVHPSYVDHEQYPNGLADVAGYWAESMIFGGVVVFDRGETEQECNSMWLHSHRMDGPTTLYPPTATQFNVLVNFLLSKPEDNTPCPLPIYGSNENRPRWHPYDALAKYHIFRDKYERKLPLEPPQKFGHRVYPIDWPELGDEWLIQNQDWIRSQGHTLPEADIIAAQIRLEEVTPSSPCWHGGHKESATYILQYKPQLSLSWIADLPIL